MSSVKSDEALATDHPAGTCPPHDPWRDPGTGKAYCRHCGIEIPDESVQIGHRLVSVPEYLDRLEMRRRTLDNLEQRILLEMDSLDVQIAGIRDTMCAWPDCHTAPMHRSKWCRLHKNEREKQTAKERQRRRRSDPQLRSLERQNRRGREKRRLPL
jgi:hypothetical protein